MVLSIRKTDVNWALNLKEKVGALAELMQNIYQQLQQSASVDDADIINCLKNQNKC